MKVSRFSNTGTVNTKQDQKKKIIWKSKNVASAQKN